MQHNPDHRQLSMAGTWGTSWRHASGLPFQRCPLDSRLSRCLCRQIRKV